MFYPHIPGGNHVANPVLDMRRRGTFRVSKACYTCGEERGRHSRVAEGVVHLVEEFG